MITATSSTNNGPASRRDLSYNTQRYNTQLPCTLVLHALKPLQSIPFSFAFFNASIRLP